MFGSRSDARTFAAQDEPPVILISRNAIEREGPGLPQAPFLPITCAHPAQSSRTYALDAFHGSTQESCDIFGSELGFTTLDNLDSIFTGNEQWYGRIHEWPDITPPLNPHNDIGSQYDVSSVPAFVTLPALDLQLSDHDDAVTSRQSNVANHDEANGLDCNSDGQRMGCNASMKEWLQSHAPNPYPTAAEIKAFAQAEGKTERQIQVAFRNLRQRMNKLGSRSLSQCNASSSTPSLTAPVANNTVRSNVKLHEDDADDLTYFKGEMTCTKDSWLYQHPYTIAEDDFNLPWNKQTIMDEIFTYSSSPSNTGDKAVVQVAGTKRKGRKRHPLRHSALGNEIMGRHINASKRQTKEGEQVMHRYHCTACCQSFRNPFGWKRHEEGVHWHTDTLWSCMLHELTIIGTRCIFCSDFIFDTFHLEEHDIRVCDTDHCFSRKDLLKQHVQQVHLRNAHDGIRKGFTVPLSWIKPVKAEDAVPDALWCGFCSREFGSVTERMKHVQRHFQDGLSMDS